MKYFFLLAISLINQPLFSQDLYRPRSLQDAYTNQTRSNDGSPGVRYWQNTARYDIQVTALPPDRMIRGKESITYFNNSPDTLFGLYFKLIQNIHKASTFRAYPPEPDYITDGLSIDSFLVDDDYQPWTESSFYVTVKPVRLPKPLQPGDSVRLNFTWHYEIAKKSGREGMIDSTTYFLAYFYPRVAVYDDYQGWDYIEHGDALEFYNDFNDYKLTVNVPANYLVWATGELQNPQQVLQKKYLDRLRLSRAGDSVVHIVTSEDLQARQISTQNTLNSWVFKYNNISDVAVALSDHFVWDAGSVVVDPATKRRAGMNAVYNDTARDYHTMVQFGKKSLKYLSTVWPGVAYPFPKMTVFQGYAGMEYPMMANDESYHDTAESHLVAEHEISHTWFPFYMGINETRYGFMDEGWATALELLYDRQRRATDEADEKFRRSRIQGWFDNKDASNDIPIITPLENLSLYAVGDNEYGKPALAYLALKDLLGDELFRKCLHGFMDRWHGKHPSPWDFFYSFNDISGENLNWFWNSWFFERGYVDIKLKSVGKDNNGVALSLENVGGFAVPFDIRLTYSDGSNQTTHSSPGIWKKGANVVIPVATKKSVQKAEVLTGVFMDAFPANNEKQM